MKKFWVIIGFDSIENVSAPIGLFDTYKDAIVYLYNTNEEYEKIDDYLFYNYDLEFYYYISVTNYIGKGN